MIALQPADRISQDEYVVELVNTDYVARQLEKHQILCPGVVRNVLAAEIFATGKRSYKKLIYWCDCCDWDVKEVRFVYRSQINKKGKLKT